MVNVYNLYQFTLLFYTFIVTFICIYRKGIYICGELKQKGRTQTKF